MAFMALDIKAESNDIIEELKKSNTCCKNCCKFYKCRSCANFRWSSRIWWRTCKLVWRNYKDVGADVSIGIFKNSGGEDFIHKTKIKLHILD